MVRVSEKFKARLKLADEPAYRIAFRAGLNPTTLSKILHGAERIKPGDERVKAVARVLEMDLDECFEEA